MGVKASVARAVCSCPFVPNSHAFPLSVAIPFHGSALIFSHLASQIEIEFELRRRMACALVAFDFVNTGFSAQFEFLDTRFGYAFVVSSVYALLPGRCPNQLDNSYMVEIGTLDAAVSDDF
ncbi:hypothetical protein PIB30_002240 [Stylosanthes scabra]|uniref:Uncharacterized protein n=1 Tax=Stylosanthes scabra TaxID=79078 RepID=A0ABU6T4R6_9FABA|nr:hypothetical protein [Stylosanthes scabra]